MKTHGICNLIFICMGSPASIAMLPIPKMLMTSNILGTTYLGQEKICEDDHRAESQLTIKPGSFQEKKKN